MGLKRSKQQQLRAQWWQLGHYTKRSNMQQMEAQWWQLGHYTRRSNMQQMEAQWWQLGHYTRPTRRNLMYSRKYNQHPTIMKSIQLYHIRPTG